MPKPKSDQKAVTAAKSTYDIGYAKPPAENRFKPGQSGNLKGRPRQNPKPRIDPAMEPTHGYILDEVYRQIRVKDGDQTTEMPAIRVVMRTLVNDAMAGKSAARKQLIQLSQAAEAKQLELQLQDIETYITLKIKWLEEFARCDQAGIPRPEPVLHPDDINLNSVTSALTISGPIDEKSLAGWQKLQEMIADHLDEITGYEKNLRNNPESTNFRGLIVSTYDAIEKLALKRPDWRYRHDRLTSHNLEWPEQLQKFVAAKRAQYLD